MSTPETICKKGLATFLDFVRDIYKLEFDQKPNYDNLKRHLVYILYKNLLPNNNKFDWNNSENSEIVGESEYSESHDLQETPEGICEIQETHNKI